ncbi:MAG TPA: DNA polymerase III subunit delta' [Burkholderiaceae bacterium]|nr:DNA polymerase III subunit delta' [Burkholderiaceae bacterium]
MERLTPLPWQQEMWSQLVGWRERLPHALLLHGGRGIGKRHLMTAYAQLLLCESPVDDAPCGRCAGCQLLAADNHPDLRCLTPAALIPDRNDADDAAEESQADRAEARAGKAKSREIVIDQVRKISEFLAISSHRGGRRVVLVLPAEALNASAANALLKMLEEPPPGVAFLAVSDRLDAVLPTILSRCVLLRAPVPSHEQSIAWLRSNGVDRAEAKLAEAGGAPLCVEGLSTLDPRQILDPALHDALIKLLGRGAALTGAQIVSTVPKDIAVGPAIRLLQRWGWDLLAERLAGRVRYYPQHRRQVAALGRTVEPVHVVEWTAALAQMQAVSDHPLNARLVIESALLGYAEAMRPEGTATAR